MNTLGWFVVHTFRFGFGPHHFPFFLGGLLFLGVAAVVVMLIVLLAGQFSKK